MGPGKRVRQLSMRTASDVRYIYLQFPRIEVRLSAKAIIILHQPMSTSTRRMAPAEAAFPTRDSKRLDDHSVASKRSFHNLRQLFKLPARVLTPLFNKPNNHEPRGRASLVNQTEPRTHRLMGPISPTRGLPSNSNTLPDLSALASRNASGTVLPSPNRNISEPLPVPRFPEPDYTSRPSSSTFQSRYAMNERRPVPLRTSMYPPETEAEYEAPSMPSARRTLADITRRINSPQLQIRKRLSLGPRNSSTPMISVPYTSGPTTSACQKTSPPRPIFTSAKRHMHRAEKSLSVLNEENRRSTIVGRPRSITTRDSFATTHNFTETVSSLLKAPETTTAPTAPATPPQAVFTTNPKCIYTSQPHAYWAGRFMALHDQYHSQMLHSTVNDDKLLQSFMRPDRPSTTTSKLSTKLLKAELSASSSDFQNYANCPDPPGGNQAMHNDEVRRCKRVFYTLQSLCVTAEAKNSLWGFQLRFARERKMEAVLPDGGTMEPEKRKPWTRLSRRRSGTPDSLGETF